MAPKEQQLFVEMSDGTCKSLLPIEDEDEGDYIGVKKHYGYCHHPSEVKNVGISALSPSHLMRLVGSLIENLKLRHYLLITYYVIYLL